MLSELSPEDSSSDEGVGTSLSLCFSLFVHKLIFCVNAALCPGHLVRSTTPCILRFRHLHAGKYLTYKFPTPR
ncbi:hypothetical protein LDENG_00133490 [Lucifuga dentata]|nr:hypothetical protein LDENG_00133490 [Lucifuga dentata]